MKITKELYLELKDTGASDQEIAKLFGITRRALAKRKKQWGLTNVFRAEKSDTIREEAGSLCYTCINARPSRCAWVGRGVRVFRESKVKTIQVGKEPEQVELVTACDFYVRIEGLRLHAKTKEGGA